MKKHLFLLRLSPEKEGPRTDNDSDRCRPGALPDYSGRRATA
ncbi:hypothetical protein [Parabacteroides sp. Marseille-P3160]|nr:hypothetical protein [Parabacteroides sp. Marseille-P3160]